MAPTTDSKAAARTDGLSRSLARSAPCPSRRESPNSPPRARTVGEERLADDDGDHGAPQDLQPLVRDGGQLGMLVGVAGVDERLAQQGEIPNRECESGRGPGPRPGGGG